VCHAAVLLPVSITASKEQLLYDDDIVASFEVVDSTRLFTDKVQLLSNCGVGRSPADLRTGIMEPSSPNLAAF
jgi:hypothetical protein